MIRCGRRGRRRAPPRSARLPRRWPQQQQSKQRMKRGGDDRPRQPNDSLYRTRGRHSDQAHHRVPDRPRPASRSFLHPTPSPCTTAMHCDTRKTSRRCPRPVRRNTEGHARDRPHRLHGCHRPSLSGDQRRSVPLPQPPLQRGPHLLPRTSTRLLPGAKGGGHCFRGPRLCSAATSPVRDRRRRSQRSSPISGTEAGTLLRLRRLLPRRPCRQSPPRPQHKRPPLTAQRPAPVQPDHLSPSPPSFAAAPAALPRAATRRS